MQHRSLQSVVVSAELAGTSFLVQSSSNTCQEQKDPPLQPGNTARATDRKISCPIVQCRNSFFSQFDKAMDDAQWSLPVCQCTCQPGECVQNAPVSATTGHAWPPVCTLGSVVLRMLITSLDYVCVWHKLHEHSAKASKGLMLGRLVRRRAAANIPGLRHCLCGQHTDGLITTVQCTSKL